MRFWKEISETPGCEGRINIRTRLGVSQENGPHWCLGW